MALNALRVPRGAPQAVGTNYSRPGPGLEDGCQGAPRDSQRGGASSRTRRVWGRAMRPRWGRATQPSRREVRRRTPGSLTKLSSVGSLSNQGRGGGFGRHAHTHAFSAGPRQAPGRRRRWLRTAQTPPPCHGQLAPVGTWGGTRCPRPGVTPQLGAWRRREAVPDGHHVPIMVTGQVDTAGLERA